MTRRKNERFTDDADRVVKDIRRQARRRFSSEDKIRIVSIHQWILQQLQKTLSNRKEIANQIQTTSGLNENWMRNHWGTSPTSRNINCVRANPHSRLSDKSPQQTTLFQSGVYPPKKTPPENTSEFRKISSSIIFGRYLAGAVGVEPTVYATKKRCLTIWPRPIRYSRL